MSSNADIGKTPWHVPGNKARRPKASAVSHGQFDILDWRNCVCPTPYTRGAPLRNIRATVSASQSAKASLGHVSDAPAFDMRHIVHRQCPTSLQPPPAMSPYGTFETWQRALRVSGVGGRPEVVFRGRQHRFLTN